jgi:hypothetical protein
MTKIVELFKLLLLDVMIDPFPHKAPKNYWYETEEYKRNVLRIVLWCNKIFDYNGGKKTKTVWGFYNKKTRQFFAPKNYNTVGELVDIRSTTPWTAMQINLTPLERCFL